MRNEIKSFVSSPALYCFFLSFSCAQVVSTTGRAFICSDRYDHAGVEYTALRPDDELLKERTKPGEGAKKWDKIILGLSFLATIGMYCTAGFDSGRYLWSPQFHWSLYLSGILLTVAGQLLFLIAQKQNRFFSSTVRIQTERGHTVCDTGLYSIVRHPAYMGSFIQALGFPLLFGSLWSIIPTVVSIIILVTRTYLEDNTLQQELLGYAEYAQKTRYKLLHICVSLLRQSLYL
jgi:protein-S-isoprenylcysteine O-methyltransferase Ste14